MGMPPAREGAKMTASDFNCWTNAEPLGAQGILSPTAQRLVFSKLRPYQIKGVMTYKDHATKIEPRKSLCEKGQQHFGPLCAIVLRSRSHFDASLYQVKQHAFTPCARRGKMFLS